MRIKGLATTAVLALLASGAVAQQLDPQIGVPLQAMFQRAAAQCQAGNGLACQQAQQIEQSAMQLTQAQGACQAGNQQACQFYNNGAQQVMMSWQQMQMQAMPQQPVQGFSPQQQQWEHQQRMQQQQQQFQQQQQQYQQQQRLNDGQHQRFIEQLRR